MQSILIIFLIGFIAALFTIGLRPSQPPQVIYIQQEHLGGESPGCLSQFVVILIVVIGLILALSTPG
jgi:hypothetical protein